MTTPPNIILILADDMGYGDFGCFNYGASRTPTLDHLVSDGVSLTQHYSASPVCAPARASLMTGRYPHRTGVIDTLETRGLDRLALREVTIAELLKRAGYATGLIGKWQTARTIRAIIRTAAASTSSRDFPAAGSRTTSGISIATARSCAPTAAT